MVNGCNRSQVFTFTATACGITSTCTRTFNWTQVTPPSFNGSCSNGVINLGCNPVTLPACDPNITASNECGPISVTCNVGIQVNGCNRQQTLTYVANAVGCGAFSTCKNTQWQVTTAPVFANCDNTYDLGCNPATIPTCANVQTAPFGGAVTASNECGNVGGITCSEGSRYFKWLRSKQSIHIFCDGFLPQLVREPLHGKWNHYPYLIIVQQVPRPWLQPCCLTNLRCQCNCYQ